MERKNYSYYEVRTEGDSEFDFFVEPANSVDGQQFNYDPCRLRSALSYAKKVGGYVVWIKVKRVSQ